MLNVPIKLLLLLALIAAHGRADLPRGYEFIRITDGSAYNTNPRMNSHGDVVFSSRSFPANANVMLFSDGVLSNVTDDDVGNGSPSINDDRVIVWSRYSGPPDRFGRTAEIVRLQDGVMDYLTDDSANDVGARINDVGHVVWYKYQYDGCRQADRQIEFFDGTEIWPLTDGDHSDQAPVLNTDGSVVWARYDFCDSPWTSKILLLRRDGTLSTLSGDQFAPQSPTINDAGTIAWFYAGAERNQLVLSKNGEITEPGPGSSPKLNNHDDLIYTLDGHDEVNDQICVFLRGDHYCVSDDSMWSGQGQINDRTDMCWISGVYPAYDIVMLKRLPFGDMNCDKQVNFDDIDGFVAAISGKEAYLERFPDCDWWLADINDDRKIDFNDIDPFVDCLVNNACP